MYSIALDGKISGPLHFHSNDKPAVRDHVATITALVATVLAATMGTINELLLAINTTIYHDGKDIIIPR